MKRWKFRGLAFLVLCLSLLAPSFVAWGESDDTKDQPELLAEAAAVMDVDTGNLIYNKNDTGMQYPGNLTKIMTVLLLVEDYDLEEKVSFSEILYDLEEGSLSFGLQPGEEITLYDAACAVMLESADDVCNGIAEYIAGSPEAFAELMNVRAEELGCVNTHFSNPRGLYGDDHYTCAYDLALIARAAYGNESFREICGLTEYIIPATNLTGTPRHLLNDYQMLQYGSDYYQEWCAGGKESNISQSPHAIVTFGSSGERNLVSVVMGVNDGGEAYEDTAQLVNYGFDSFSANEGETTEEELSEKELSGKDLIPAAETSGIALQTEGEVSGEILQTEEEVSGEILQTEERDSGEEMIPSAEGAGEVIFQKEEDSREKETQNAGRGNVLARLADYLSAGQRIVLEYTRNHFVAVCIIWCILMLILLVSTVLLLLRCITDIKIRRKRKKAEKIWREREAQIAGMTVEELEAELRRKKAAAGIHEGNNPAGDQRENDGD